MTRTWLTIQVELVSGRGEYHWPRPGRIFVARRSFTFRQLANAINRAFGRWELAHLHRFVLGDGTEVVPAAWWDEVDDDAADDVSTTLSRLQLGEQFAYEFDLGDGWEHLCTVGPERVDPAESTGPSPTTRRPTSAGETSRTSMVAGGVATTTPHRRHSRTRRPRTCHRSCPGGETRSHPPRRCPASRRGYASGTLTRTRPFEERSTAAMGGQ